jgi:hypothetical protein
MPAFRKSSTGRDWAPLANFHLHFALEAYFFVCVCVPDGRASIVRHQASPDQTR